MEDVRGVAGVALATPFFQDLFYMPSRLLVIWSSGHPVIRTSGHLVFWPSGHLIIRPSDHLVIRPSGHLVIWSSRLLAIWSSDDLVIRSSNHTDFWSSGHLVFWPSVLMPQKCPYWNIFDLPNCRLHQSQIPYVLPVHAIVRECRPDRAYLYTTKLVRSAAPDIDIRVESNPNITNFILVRTGLWLNFELADSPIGKSQP